MTRRIIAMLLVLLVLAVNIAAAAPEQVRQRGIETRVTFPIRHATTGAFISTATGFDAEVSKYSDSTDPGTFTNATNNATILETASGSGVYRLTLTSTEMDADFIDVKVTSTSTSAVAVFFTVNTKLGATFDGVAQAVAAGPPSTITLVATDTAETNAYANNVSVVINSATTGAGQVRCIASNVVTTDVATLVTPWNPLPTGTIRYSLIATPNCNGAVGAGGIVAGSLGTGAIDGPAMSQAAADKVWSSTTKTLSGTQTFNLTGSITGNITGNLSGSIGSVGTNGITNASVANDFLTASKVASDVAAENWSDAAVPFRFIHQANTLADVSPGALHDADITLGFGLKLADIMWRRYNSDIETSGYVVQPLSFQSPYGAIAKQTNNLAVAGSNLNIYRADNSEIFKTQTITGSAGATPITGIGN